MKYLSWEAGQADQSACWLVAHTDSTNNSQLGSLAGYNWPEQNLPATSLDGPEHSYGTTSRRSFEVWIGRENRKNLIYSQNLLLLVEYRNTRVLINSECITKKWKNESHRMLCCVFRVISKEILIRYRYIEIRDVWIRAERSTAIFCLSFNWLLGSITGIFHVGILKKKLDEFRENWFSFSQPGCHKSSRTNRNHNQNNKLTPLPL